MNTIDCAFFNAMGVYISALARHNPVNASITSAEAVHGENNGDPEVPLHRLSGLEMENRIDSYSSRKQPLLLDLRDGLEILTDVHP